MWFPVAVRWLPRTAISDWLYFTLPCLTLPRFFKMTIFHCQQIKTAILQPYHQSTEPLCIYFWRSFGRSKKQRNARIWDDDIKECSDKTLAECTTTAGDRKTWAELMCRSVHSVRPSAMTKGKTGLFFMRSPFANSIQNRAYPRKMLKVYTHPCVGARDHGVWGLCWRGFVFQTFSTSVLTTSVSLQHSPDFQTVHFILQYSRNVCACVHNNNEAINKLMIIICNRFIWTANKKTKTYA